MSASGMESKSTGGGENPAAGVSVSAETRPIESRLGPGPEFDLIRGFLRGRGSTGRADVRLGPGDDCAVVAGDGIVLTIDLSVEDVHFRREWMSPFDVGYRAATASLSDLAAMAARPIGVLAALALPASDREEYASEVMRGIVTAVERAEAVLLGGDVTGSRGPLVVDVVAVGEAPRPILRSGARPGDEVWVTGRLGGAATAVAALERGERPDAAAYQAFVAPVARVREAQWLAARSLPTAMLDLSDGLGGDAGHIASASEVAIVLDARSIPIHVSAAAGSPDQAVRLALSGGEDYELCFTAAPGTLQEAHEDFEAAFGVGLSLVGVVEAGDGVHLRWPDGKREALIAAGFQHFSGHVRQPGSRGS
jgi:thiamine-monophosphate kinase